MHVKWCHFSVKYKKTALYRAVFLLYIIVMNVCKRFLQGDDAYVTSIY